MSCKSKAENGKEWTVVWEVISTGNRENGGLMTKEQAQNFAEYGNLMYPTIHHWVERTPNVGQCE